MKQLYGLLTAVIFLWRYLHRDITPVASSTTADPLAPLTSIVTQISADLWTSALLAAAIMGIFALARNALR